MENQGKSSLADLDFDDPGYPPEDRPSILYSLAAADWQPSA